MAAILHLRAEKYPKGLRALITPETCKYLVKDGNKVVVERSDIRVFKDAQYVDAGATLVDAGSWMTAPSEHIIVGTKELPDGDFPLVHTHTHWAHAYGGQAGAPKLLKRFVRGGGNLLDIEYVQDNEQRPVIWFGYHAGYASMAVAINAWSHQQQFGSRPMEPISPYSSVEEMDKEVKVSLMRGTAKLGRQPKVLIIGAYGKSGTGAADCLSHAGLHSHNVVKWGRADTASGGPFEQILDFDILVNCILLTDPIPPFLTPEMLNKPERKLSLICDVSCDLGREGNPLPIYTDGTHFDKAAIAIPVKAGPPLNVVAIAYTPSLLPTESSIATAEALLPAIAQLKNWKTADIWHQARAIFHQKIAESMQGSLAARL